MALMMKCAGVAAAALFLALVASSVAAAAASSAAAAFAPVGGGAAMRSTTGSSSRCSSTARSALADRIFGMDLFAPNRDVNAYGARKNKKLTVGKITDMSYIPAGLTRAEYEKIRAAEQRPITTGT
jgi:hypothetical protein